MAYLFESDKLFWPPLRRPQGELEFQLANIPVKLILHDYFQNLAAGILHSFSSGGDNGRTPFILLCLVM